MSRVSSHRASRHTASRSPELPLVVDLDGTLTTQDSFFLMIKAAAVQDPGALLQATRAFRSSRSAAKHLLWSAVGLRADRLRFSPTLLALLRWEQQRERPLVLATGAPQPLAVAVADHLGIFDAVLGSTPETNLTGSRKSAVLVERFGAKGFDYAGNATADLPVWEESRFAIVCNAPRRVREQAASVTTVLAVMDDRRYRGPTLHSLLSS